VKSWQKDNFSRLSSSEQLPVEGTVINLFGDVVHLDILNAFQIGDCPRHFERAVIAPTRQVKPGNRCFAGASKVERSSWATTLAKSCEGKTSATATLILRPPRKAQWHR